MDQKFDTIVIGFGKAGKTLAAKLAKQGEKVALIERMPVCTAVHASMWAAFPPSVWCWRRSGRLPMI